MFIQLAKLVAAPFFRMGVEAGTGFFMKNDNPAAKAYATKVAGEEAARIPETLMVAAKAYAVFQTGGAAIGLMDVVDIPSTFNATRQALLTPWRVYHNMQNVKFLRGVADGGYQNKVDQGDDFSMRPSL